ncbi:MAG: TRAFs-binding domain-containing protein [Vicinamibacterales bacterium]
MEAVEEYQQRATTLLKQGEPLAAYDIVARGLREFPGHHGLRQVLGLALARTGASREANRLLRALVEEGHADAQAAEEAIGTLARTYKDLWAQTSDASARRQHLANALKWYLEAHDRSGGYWSGINAATMALLLGDHEQSRALARRVRDQCRASWNEVRPRHDTYWLLATLGEAELLLRDFPAAEAWYREAVARGAPGVSDLVSTRRNARLILRYQQADLSPFDACFPVPAVGLFSGHCIDRPERHPPRFPPALEEAVRRALDERLRGFDIGFGYSSAASGGDILFLESLQPRAELYIVLPYNWEHFERDSVDFLAGSGWAPRYRALLASAKEVVTASEQRMPGGAMSHEYGFHLLDGIAALRAGELETDLVCFAVWDGQPGDGPGGTAASVEYWRKRNRRVEIVDLRALQQGAPIRVTCASADAASDGRETNASGFDAQLVGILFADVAGFSKLTEEEIPRFVEHYLGRVSDVLAATSEQPLLTNTWGDGLYLVFKDVQQTGRFALRLSEALRTTDWSACGLPNTLSLRVAVHAGPAYACSDPVTGRVNYLGAHVALAARIEPVTPPGEVYGSRAFAALAASSQVEDFACDYVGQTPLAKAFGTYPMYVLHSRT